MKAKISLFLIAVLMFSVVLPIADSSKESLEKIEFIHWKKGAVKGQAKSPSNTCYKFLTPTKVRWKILPVNYVINPINPQGLSTDFIGQAILTSAETWDTVTSKELTSNTYEIDYTASYGVQDYKNSIVFGNYPTENVIAVTTVWYIPSTKEVVEFDMMFDTDWVWGDATFDPTVMDLQNIATHEFGHAFGLGDVYSSSCTEVTMYGYSDYGETKKRTLELPDITGLQILYGQ
ncbi:MAG: matrixin family metalloprotease [Candidatus Aenigmatarchaeota archaeon]